MGKHNFREFFFLAAPENPKANKKAVCWSCIQKHTLPVALTNSDCFVSNKAKLCRSHLKKCLNFEQEYNEEERKEILLHNNSIINFTNNPSTSTAIKQTTLNNFISRPLSNKDIPHFENLVLLMIVSNGLPFTFLENKETQDVFKFIAPALKLPGRKAISDRILPDSASQLKKSILEVASNDKIGDIMDDAEKNGIQVNCYVSDSAGEYAAARRQLRVEYPKAALKTLVTKFSPERVGTVSNSRSGFSRQRFSSGNNNTNKVIYPDVIAIHQKVLAMSQLRSDILKMRKREEIDNTEKQYKRIHIAASVQPYNDEEEVDKEAEEETETQINISDCEEEADTEISIEDNNTSEILSADHWLRMVENWVKMLDIENHLDNGENVNEEPIEFELGGRDIHPADDPLAKWDLLFLFNDSLEAPVYLSSLTNF
ncbi:unnamed protein product [Rhizophagus irregularis]|nr:unnamed protein product [Rhizophagus irregularis]